MTEREIFEKFDELSLINWIQRVIKMFLLIILSWQILLSIVEVKAKRGIRAIDGFRKKLFIPDYEISVAIEHVVKSKIGTIFKNEKILEEYSVRIYETDTYFYEHYKKNNKKKKQVDDNDKEYILFRTDIYFTEYSLLVEIDEKGHTDRDLIFEQKRQKALEKKT